MSSARDIEEAAAVWLARRDSSAWSEEDEQQFQRWLSASPHNDVAYVRLEHAWRRADRLAALRLPPSVKPVAPPSYWKPLAIAASVLLVIVSSIVAFGVYPFERGMSYATPVGVQSIVPLPDGSRIELNTDTVLRAEIAKDRRVVWLDRGEAYFDVAHDRLRPFQVLAGDRKISVVGTKFAVRRIGEDVTVTVAEGRVRIEPPSSSKLQDEARLVKAGQVAVLANATSLVASTPRENIRSALSWRQGVITFDQDTLTEAAGEFNRYNQKKLIVADAKLGQMTLSGRFEAANVDAFVRLLHRAYGLHVEDDGRQVLISE